MAKKTKNLEITIRNEGGKFNPFFKKNSIDKRSYDFEGISTMRKLAFRKIWIYRLIKRENRKERKIKTSCYNRFFKYPD